MEKKSSHQSTTCPSCGRPLGKAQSFCVYCGARMPQSQNVTKSKFPRTPLIAIIAAVVVVLLLVGGITAAVLLMDTSAEVALPQTETELTASVEKTLEFLNDDGKRMAAGKAKDAPIYSVDTTLDTKEHSVTGEEKVLYTNRTGDELKEVVFRVYANAPMVRGDGPQVTVSEIEVNGKDTKATLNGSVMRVGLPETLPQDEEALITFSFKENVPEVGGSLGGLESLLGGETQGGYGIFGRSERVYDLGYVMPLIVSYRNGNWDTRKAPSFGDVADFDCAYFNFSIDVPNGFVVAATGMPSGEDAGGGRTTYSYSAGPIRDFSVQASPDYKTATKTVGPTVVTSYYFEGATEMGEKVLEMGCNALNQFNQHIGQYPFKRLNICEAPLSGGAAGMEFTGQIMLAEMLYGDFGLGNMEGLEDLGGEELGDLMDSLSGSLLGDTLEFVTAHEVCHQWWGMAIGGDAIDHPWQDESLTNYCSVLYFRWQHGEEAAQQQRESQLAMQYSTMSMLGIDDAVVDKPVDSFSSQEQYVAAVYSKGALFFEALEAQMGRDAFEKSLKDYYQQYAFENPSPEDMMKVFESNSGDPAAVAALHQRWIKETHGDEDIASTGMPGSDLLQDLLEDFNLEDLEKELEDLNLEDLDLGPLEELFNEFFEEGEEGSNPFPSTEPSKEI